jgi:hypothetical protein
MSSLQMLLDSGPNYQKVPKEPIYQNILIIPLPCVIFSIKKIINLKQFKNQRKKIW